MKTSTTLLMVAMLGAAVYACTDSGSSGQSNGGGGTGNSGAGAGAGNVGGGGASGGAGAGSSTGGGTPDTNNCGDSPCADFTGSKTFSEASAPGNASELFSNSTTNPTGTDAAKEPGVLYPNHETMFPINVSHIRHEWSTGTANNLFRLNFVGPNTTVEVFTADSNWTPSAEAWDWIAESNRGASVTLQVTALDTASPASAWQSGAITLLFSDTEVEGALYYWATGSKGIMRATVSDPNPVKFYTDPTTDDDTCVACHSVSRDGKRISMGYGGENLREIMVADRSTVVPVGAVAGTKGPSASFTTFSPDGKMLLLAAEGGLTLIDADTGATIGANDGLVPLPEGKAVTHPDWNPAGDKVAVAMTSSKANGKNVDAAEIAVIPYASGTWGTPTILVSQTAGENNFYPSWSPDGKWLVYASAPGGGSKDQVLATLKIVAATGGTPKVLVRLNERVNNEDGITHIGNTMPTWAPATKPGIFWLAFSSLRAYVSLRPADAKLDQIYIAAIDTTKDDPGYAAFWAPFQSLEEGNHRAFWAHADDDKQCSCVEVCGDSVDNNCNGVADEASCSVCGASEICGDEIDNDCDCLVDECPIGEICDDDIDNDGDGLIDAEDPACQAPD